MDYSIYINLLNIFMSEGLKQVCPNCNAPVEACTCPTAETTSEEREKGARRVFEELVGRLRTQKDMGVVQEGLLQETKEQIDETIQEYEDFLAYNSGLEEAAKKEVRAYCQEAYDAAERLLTENDRDGRRDLLNLAVGYLRDAWTIAMGTRAPNEPRPQKLQSTT